MNEEMLDKVTLTWAKCKTCKYFEVHGTCKYYGEYTHEEDYCLKWEDANAETI